MHVIFRWSQAFLIIVSVQRGLGGGRKMPSGALGTFSFRAEDADVCLDLVVIRRELFVSDRPVVAHAVGRVCLEVRFTKSKRDASPMIRASAYNTRTEPAELRTREQ